MHRVKQSSIVVLLLIKRGCVVTKETLPAYLVPCLPVTLVARRQGIAFAVSFLLPETSLN